MATIMIKIMANIRKEIESQLMSGMPAYLRARLGLFAYLRAQTINRIIGEIQNKIHIHHGVGIMIVLTSLSHLPVRIVCGASPLKGYERGASPLSRI